MRYQIAKNSITIPREVIQKSRGIVVLPLKEYQELQERARPLPQAERCERAVPTYQLYGKEAEELDKLVEEGLRDYEAGRTISAPSLREALDQYERGKKNKKR